MALPPRVYFTLTEAAARWGCSPADIAEWSVIGDLQISTGIRPVTCGETVVAGLVQVHAADIFPLFRRCGTGPQSCNVKRVRPQSAEEWLFITDPAEGVPVAVPDLVILAREATRFEDAHDLFQRGSNRPGPDFKYGWIQLLQWLAVHLHEEGLPATQKELLDRCQDWLIENSPDGELPTERSIRTYVAPIWKALRKEGATP